jgi:integrase
VRLYPPVEVTLPWHDLRDLKRHGKQVTRRLLFTRPDGGPLNRMSFNRSWTKAWKTAGIPAGPANGCHVLRHTAASAWLSGGLGLARAASYLGDTQEVLVRVTPTSCPTTRTAPGPSWMISWPRYPRAHVPQMCPGPRSDAGRPR